MEVETSGIISENFSPSKVTYLYASSERYKACTKHFPHPIHQYEAHVMSFSRHAIAKNELRNVMALSDSVFPKLNTLPKR